MDWNRSLQYVALTDIGMRRSNNQDSHAVVLAPNREGWTQRGHFFMVADGMGAHAAGELASKLAVEGVSHLYGKYTELSPPEALQRAVAETNAKVHQRGLANADFRNMGTTASALILLPQGAFVAHIGDSRVYRLRGGTLHQLTCDHSLVWDLTRAGQLSGNSELMQSIPKNVITKSLGPNATVDADIEGPLPVQQGDTYLLCSDGLTGRVSDEELATILASLPPAEAGQMLVDLANLRGGHDNITLVIAQVADPDLATPEAVDAPIKIGVKESAPVHPVVWVGAVVCFLMAALLHLTHNPILALVAALGGTCASLIGAVSRYRSRSPGITLTNGRRLGKGPYVQVASLPLGDAVDRLTAFTSDLRRSSSLANRIRDWAEFDEHCAAAAKQRRDGNLGEAFRSLARAARTLMQNIRDAQAEAAGDSSIEL